MGCKRLGWNKVTTAISGINKIMGDSSVMLRSIISKKITISILFLLCVCVNTLTHARASGHTHTHTRAHMPRYIFEDSFVE